MNFEILLNIHIKFAEILKNEGEGLGFHQLSKQTNYYAQSMDQFLDQISFYRPESRIHHPHGLWHPFGQHLSATMALFCV